MNDNKLEKVIFILLRVFGVLSIIGGFLSEDNLFSKDGLIVLNHKTILGNIYMISPIILVEMVVTIIIYLLFIKFIAKHISISKKNTSKHSL